MRSQEQSLTSTESIAWAAGLFEGEGWLRGHRLGQQLYLEIGIEMRDLDIIERFVGILIKHGIRPERRTSGPRKAATIRLRQRRIRNPKHSDIYSWKTCGNTAENAYQLLRPWLGSRRLARGDSILAEAAEIRARITAPRSCEECGEPFTTKRYGHHQRYCSALCRGRARAKRPGEHTKKIERQRRYKAKLRAPSDEPWHTYHVGSARRNRNNAA